MAFFVAEFVLVMQFLWKYIDEIVGKGISLGVLLELIFYFAVRIIPEAVPVTILISSVMVFGNLAEKHELSSMKSAGVSLTRIMIAGFVLSVFTALFSLFASNYLKVRADHKFKSRFISVRKQDASLNIEEGVFTSDFQNFTIKVGKKEKEGGNINDILIYDNSGTDKKKINMLVADHGKMYSPEGTSYFIMDLEDGEQYRELTTTNSQNKNSKPFIRTKFKSWSKVFDMSTFDFEAQNLNSNRKKYDLKNTINLLKGIDSLSNERVINKEKNYYNYSGLLSIEEVREKAKKAKSDDATLPKKVTDAIAKKEEQEKRKNQIAKKKFTKKQIEDLDLADATSLLATFQDKDAKSIVRSMKFLADKKGDNISKVERQDTSFKYLKSAYVLRLHQMYSWAVVCIVFLFIGAPLGSIVRKGGYGYPLLIAIIFFMLFIVMNILGEKLHKAEQLTAIPAAWLPNIVLIPFALVISYLALNDVDHNTVRGYFSKLTARFKKPEPTT